MNLNEMKCFSKKKFAIIIILGFILYVNVKLNSYSYYSLLLAVRGEIDQRPNINIFDLRKSLTPSDIYSSIKCKLSARIYDVAVTICVHELDKDKYVR
jgi:hypothetical protein